jgi:hypothetical protein
MITVSDVFPNTVGTPNASMVRPVFDRIIDRTRELAPTLAGVELTAAALVTAPDQVRRAYAELVTLSDEHVLLRQIQAEWRRMGYRPTGVPAAGQHRNPYATPGSGAPTFVSVVFDTRTTGLLSPSAHAVAPSTVSRVGPPDALPRLLFLTGDPGAWIPTPAEEDAAFQALVEQITSHRKSLRPTVLRA